MHTYFFTSTIAASTFCCVWVTIHWTFLFSMDSILYCFLSTKCTKSYFFWKASRTILVYRKIKKHFGSFSSNLYSTLSCKMNLWTCSYVLFLLFLILSENYRFYEALTQVVLSIFLTFIFSALLRSTLNFQNLSMLVLDREEMNFCLKILSFHFGLALQVLTHFLSCQKIAILLIIFSLFSSQFSEEIDFFSIALKVIFAYEDI